MENSMKYLIFIFIFLMSLVYNFNSSYADEMIIQIDDLFIMIQAYSTPERVNYNTAAKYCGELVLGDYDDWELPSYRMMKDIVELEKYKSTRLRINNGRDLFFWTTGIKPMFCQSEWGPGIVCHRVVGGGASGVFPDDSPRGYGICVRHIN